MTYDHPEFAGSKVHAKVQRPRDSATLILIRRGAKAARILMGMRSAGHAFMPNKFVFPGGRLDAADMGAPWSRDLHPATLAKLVARMRGRPSERRARGLAQAAIRETFMRAITPPGRTRRYDSRFFVADADTVSNLDAPVHQGDAELLTLSWLTLEEIAGLDLPLITIDVLNRLKPFLDRGRRSPRG